MPMMIVCDKLAYVPGQLITGHVVIICKSPQKVKGLTMRFIGRSSKLMGEVEGTKRYKKEVYFDEKIDIFGHDGSNIQLRVGETLYPFTFPLPPGLPSTFEWPDGNVLYFAEAKLTRASWKDKRVSTRIQVDGVYDLNLEPSVVTPIEVKRQKYVKHLLTKSGPFGFTFKCSRSGFVRGHSLPFSVEIRNLSKVDTRKLRISLLQEVKPDGGKPVATLMEQMKGPPVTAGEVVTWEARLKIPAGIPPSNLGNVLSYPAVTNVYYYLHVQLSLKNCREEPICIKIPVTIGTISYNRRALSVPSLDDPSSYLPYATNGHRVDCPMSQLILPSAAISTSQFSPHLVSVNTSTSFTHTHVTRGHSLLPQTLSSRSPPVQILGPVRQYEYYFEYEDANGTNRSVTSRSGSLFQRRRNQANLTNGRSRRYFMPPTATSESPPPSYDEIFTRERMARQQQQQQLQHQQEASGSATNPNVITNTTQAHDSSGEEALQKTVLSAQLSSSSSSSLEEEEEDDELVLTSANDTLNSGRDTSASDQNSEDEDSSEGEEEEDDDNDEDDDDDACSTVSANEEFLSCSGSSSSFEEFNNKCHQLQINASNNLQSESLRLLEATMEQQQQRNDELQNQNNYKSQQHPHHVRSSSTKSLSCCNNNNNNTANRPCPCGKVCVNVQGGGAGNPNKDVYQHFSALLNSEDAEYRRNANHGLAICENHSTSDGDSSFM